MQEILMPKEKARRYLVHYQGLLYNDQFVGESGIIDFIKKVGCIQFDPLNVVGRNPELVLQSRIKGFRPIDLEKLLYEDRHLIDAWDKMMAIYHVEDWPKFKRIRHRHSLSNVNTMKYRSTEAALDYMDDVKSIIEKEGPKLGRDINIGGSGKGRWGSGKYSSVALDQLYHLGELGIYKKKNNQKVFELIERLLPEEILKAEDPFKDDHEFLRWYILRRINSIGMWWSRNGGGWLGHYLSNKAERLQVIAELVEEGLLLPVKVEGIKDNFYIHKDNVEQLQEDIPLENREMRFLAPLDNLMWDRDLIEKLFDFKYTWEVYVPKAKRKYGYYVLPILYGDEIIGRF
jgi:uncharacterized protein YcaQ